MFDDYKNSEIYLDANEVTRAAIDERMAEEREKFAQEQREMEEQKPEENTFGQKVTDHQESWLGDPLSAWRKMNESKSIEQRMAGALTPDQLEAEMAVQARRISPPEPESVVEYDAFGKLLPPKKTPTTSRQQMEYMKAIKKQYGQSS